MSPWTNVSHSPDRPQTSANAAWQKEGSGRQNSLQIELRQFSWVPHPMIQQHGASRILHQAPESQYHDENVVNLADERDEVRDEVHRHYHIRNCASNQQLVDSSDAIVSQQAVHKPNKVG